MYFIAEDQWQNNRKSLPGSMDRAVLRRSQWLSQQRHYTFIGYVGRPCILSPRGVHCTLYTPNSNRVHPQNFRFQNVKFQNVLFQNVWNVRFTKRQLYKTSGLQNLRSSKRQVFKTSGCKKNIHIYSVLVVGGNPQILLQPCLQAKWWLWFILYFRKFFCYISP